MKDFNLKQFDENRGALPPICYGLHPTENLVVCLMFGEEGYFPYFQNDGASRETLENMVTFLNTALGVTNAQRKAMEFGSMFGFDKKGANPQAWEREK